MIEKSEFRASTCMIKLHELVLIRSLLQSREGLVEQTIFFIDCVPHGSTDISSVGLFIVKQVDQGVICFLHFFVGTFLIVNAPLFIILGAIDYYWLFFLGFFKTIEDVCRERLRKLVITFHYEMSLGLVLLPKVRHIFLLAFADRALAIVAEALLGPEGTLSFEIDFVCSEERSLF